MHINRFKRPPWVAVMYTRMLGDVYLSPCWMVVILVTRNTIWIKHCYSTVWRRPVVFPSLWKVLQISLHAARSLEKIKRCIWWNKILAKKLLRWISFLRRIQYWTSVGRLIDIFCRQKSCFLTYPLPVWSLRPINENSTEHSWLFMPWR